MMNTIVYHPASRHCGARTVSLASPSLTDPGSAKTRKNSLWCPALSPIRYSICAAVCFLFPCEWEHCNDRFKSSQVKSKLVNPYNAID